MIDLHLDGARVIVDGGASGIGPACATALVQQAASVAVLVEKV